MCMSPTRQYRTVLAQNYAHVSHTPVEYRVGTELKLNLYFVVKDSCVFIWALVDRNGTTIIANDAGIYIYGFKRLFVLKKPIHSQGLG